MQEEIPYIELHLAALSYHYPYRFPHAQQVYLEEHTSGSVLGMHNFNIYLVHYRTFFSAINESCIRNSI